jgi:hypothetical protein
MTNIPEVQFRMDIAAPGEAKAKLLELYNGKLGALMRLAYAATLNSRDYDDLPLLRDALTDPGVRIEDVGMAVYSVIHEARARALIDAAPIVNFCPVPMKAFILLALGVRSSHLKAEA